MDSIHYNVIGVCVCESAENGLVSSNCDKNNTITPIIFPLIAP